MIRSLSIAVVAFLATAARADTPYAEVGDQVNTKLVKIFGSGGIKGLVAYGTGIVVHKEGYILTVASHLLDTRDLRVHLPDGRRYSNCKVIVIEPELDVALIKIDTKEKLDIPFFDVSAAAKKPVVKPGTKVLAFSNQFEIATRDEPLSIQRSLVEAITKLHGRRGIHEVSFNGNVYVLDAITNNPGAAGGAMTTREGELLGIIGKELKNELSNTWINYAVPIQTAVEVEELDGKKRTVSIVEIVEKREKYAVIRRDRTKEKAENFTGITLVPNVVEFTPPFVEEVMPGSPAAKAGLQVDDLIVYVDGEQIASINELNQILSKVRPDTPMKIEVRRGDTLKTLSMVMGKPLQRKPVPKTPVVDK